MGRLEDGKLALPIESLNIQSFNEQVTYRIVEPSKLQKPSWIKKWSEILRLQNLNLVFVPAFLLFSMNLEGSPHVWIGLSASLGALFLHLAGNLRNDFLDHIEGFDRIHPIGGSRAIQNGWIRAFEVKRISNSFLIIGAALGLPALFVYPILWGLVVFATLIGVVAVYSYKFGLKFRKLTELAVFCLLGPLLSIGLQTAYTGRLEFQTLFLGAVLGWLAVFYLHTKNFAQLMVNSKTQMNNSVVRLGFEKSKIFLLAWWSVFLFGFAFYHWLYTDWIWAVGLVLSASLVSVPYFFNVQILTSPIGSQLLRTQAIAIKMINFVLLTWLVQSLWSFWLV